MYKGIVFFDYDGTMVDESDKISLPTAKTLESFRKLRNNGYMTAVCSGRARYHLPKIDFDFDCYVNSNGASVRVGDEIVFYDSFELEDTLKIVEFAKTHNLAFFCEAIDKCYLGEIHIERIKDMIEEFNVPADTFFPFKDATDKDLKTTNKMVLSFERNRDKLDIIMKEFNDKFGDKFITYPQIDDYGIDIAKKGFSKVIGIKEVIKKYGFDIKDTYAFGDGGNDGAMISFVGNGIVMGKHHPCLDGIGDYYTETVKNEGITKGLMHYKLI